MRGFKYILFILALIVSAGTWGQYNPSNPAEPGAPATPVKQYVLTLQADPMGGGGFNLNATSNHAEGETFWVQANTASNFTFEKWTLDGEVISTSYRFQYTMPSNNVTLIAHYTYTPSSPTEPNEPNIPYKPQPVYSVLWLSSQPSGGGGFNISSGTSYEVGASVRVQANPASNFTFVNWTLDGEVISQNRAFDYVILPGENANRLVAQYLYTPGSPAEPNEPVLPKKQYRVYLQADPANGGYFNTQSGNQFEEGSQQTFRAYNNQWYTFQNWTRNGEIVSTNSNYTLTIPNEDVTLIAHYSYLYDPGNPGEPGPSTDRHIGVYGMTANSACGQTVLFPIFLENTEEVYGVTVVVHFPEGFNVNTANVVQAERTMGHKLTVTALEDNAYRFDLTGTQAITGQNGKIFDIPVTISTDCETGKSYQVGVSNAALINLDYSKEVINARNGYIFVESEKEDGLYALFSYEKLQNRVQFNNLSSDKVYSYHWDFGDGESSTEMNPMHIYAEPGYYDVTLTVRGQTDTDVAQMTVLINDQNTWVVDGVLFLDTEVKGVRYFTSPQDLFTFMAANPINGNLTISVKPGTTFDYALTNENQDKLATIQQQLVDGNYTLIIAKNGEGDIPVINFGQRNAVIQDNVVNLFVSLGLNMVCDDVTLQLWGIKFNPSKLEELKEQTLFSGSPTKEVDFTPVSTDLTFTWTATTDTETANGYLEAGEGNIGSMTALSGSTEDCHITYHIVLTFQGTHFYETTHTITLKPTLEGKFSELMPTDGAEIETTTVRLTWNHINNAVYDVYLWNAANERPAMPVAEGISESSYVSQNFCQNNRSYNWLVVARNNTQQLTSETMQFTVRILPDLHIYNLHAITDLQAGEKAIIEWTVRNDGVGSTDTQEWSDRLWLVPDVYGGTDQPNCKLLATLPNVRSLDSGQEYTGRVEVDLEYNTYGSYYLLAASDMSGVNLIDWTSIGGTIINPYNPIIGGNADEGTYTHLFATTAVEGNLLKEHGETNSRSDNFFYTKVEIVAPSVDETDWLILKEAYQQMDNGKTWITPWYFGSESRSVAGLPGVHVRDGRVVSIDLKSNNLTGSFPYTLLQLPALTTLDLSHNQLSGQVDNNMLLDKMSGSINIIDISYNQLEGNIGALIAQMDETDVLIANHNLFTQLTPALDADTEKSIDLAYQTISGTVSLDINDEPASFLNALPSILSNGYDKNLSITIADKRSNPTWRLDVETGEQLLVSPVSGKNVYRENRDFENHCVVNNGLAVGTTFKALLVFDDGDANYDGDVDILDIQTLLSYMFNEWPNTQLFNYTAANLLADSRINVQDIVKTVNIILDTPVDGNSGANRRKGADNDMPANIAYLSDGALCLQLAEPVTVISLTIEGASTAHIRSMLPAGEWQCMMKTVGNQTRVVFFSPMGSVLTEGTHQLLQLSADEAEMVDIQLANQEAHFVGAGISDSAPTAIASMAASDARCVVSGQGIDLTLQEGMKSALMKIYATDGRLIHTFTLQDASAGIYRAGDNLQPGTYIVSVVITDKTGHVRKSVAKVLIRR